MKKRFTDTEIWKKKWFMELSIEYKLFWFYLKDNCDNVGVWDENVPLANFVIKTNLEVSDILEVFKDQIMVFGKDQNKWWLRDFCDFQYGELSEESGSKPIKSYISLLKKHSLWIGYAKGMDTLKDKDKEKDKVKEEEKDKETLKSRKHKFSTTARLINTEKQILAPITLNTFVEYWTEGGSDLDNFRAEDEKHWDLEARLRRWKVDKTEVVQSGVPQRNL